MILDRVLRRLAPAVVLVGATAALVGCSNDTGEATGDRDGAEGVVAAPIETDSPTVVPLSPSDLDQAVSAAGIAYLGQQLPGAQPVVEPSTMWLRPGDTGAVHVARWSATVDGAPASGQLALVQASDGGFSVIEAESDSPNGAANLTQGAILVAQDGQPSQTLEDAAGDGISPIVAELSLADRVDLGWGAPDYLSARVAQDDRWIVSRYPLEVGIQLREAGELADVETILGYELLHLSGGESVPATVIEAIPIDVLSPAWVAVGNGATYSGRKAATSGLNPVLIRIDSATGAVEKLIAVMPDRVIGDPSIVPDGWTIATPGQAELMMTVAHAAPDFFLIDEIFAQGAS